MQFSALLSAGLGKAHELSIGVDSREMMAEIVRNGAGHPANRGQTIGLKQLPVRAFEFAAHSVKGQRELANLRGTICTQLVVKITLAKGAAAGHQRFQRAGYAA